MAERERKKKKKKSEKGGKKTGRKERKKGKKKERKEIPDPATHISLSNRIRTVLLPKRLVIKQTENIGSKKSKFNPPWNLVLAGYPLGSRQGSS